MSKFTLWSIALFGAAYGCCGMSFSVRQQDTGVDLRSLPMTTLLAGLQPGETLGLSRPAAPPALAANLTGLGLEGFPLSRLGAFRSDILAAMEKKETPAAVVAGAAAPAADASFLSRWPLLTLVAFSLGGLLLAAFVVFVSASIKLSLSQRKLRDWHRAATQ